MSTDKATWVHPVDDERFRRFMQDGDDEIFHKDCGGKFVLENRDSVVVLSPTKVEKIRYAKCNSCRADVWYDKDEKEFRERALLPYMYAITPQREIRYKLVEVTEGKNRFTTLVPLTP